MSDCTELSLLATQTNIQTTEQIGRSQRKLSEARAQLKLEQPEATKSVKDPSGTKPSRLTARQRARHPKLIATEDILSAVVESPSCAWTRLSSSEQYLQRLDHPSVEPFYAQLEEIRRIQAQFRRLASSSHAQVDPQARR